MGVPTILIDSATGSDSAASGAGPATAITGSKGRTRNTASQLRVGFFEGSAPDLSGVLADGTHVLWINIATAGARNFSSIAAVKDTQQTDTGAITTGTAILVIGSTTGYSVGDVIKVVGAGAASADLYSTILSVDSSIQLTLNDNASTTQASAAVTNAKQITLSTSQGLNTGTTDTSWAIGGKRAAVFSTSSVKLWENNSAAGDAMPGWTAQLASAHSETKSATVNFRRAGDTTTGPIILQAAAGAATRPLLTFSNNGDAMILRGGSFRAKGFEVQNSNGTKTASRAFATTSGTLDGIVIDNVKVSHATNKFWKGVELDVGSVRVVNCEIGYTASFGVSYSQSASTNVDGQLCAWNFIHDCGGNGINFLSKPYIGVTILGNIIYNCAGHGISYDNSRTDSLGIVLIAHNTIDSCTGSSDGIRVVTAADNAYTLNIVNNLCSNNGGYGINFVSATMTAAWLDAHGVICTNNDCYNNTSGPYNPSGYGLNDPNANPSYTAAASGDFRVGTGVKALGYPTGNVGTGSITPSYVDIGAAQRIEPSGGGLLLHPGNTGGMRG